MIAGESLSRLYECVSNHGRPAYPKTAGDVTFHECVYLNSTKSTGTKQEVCVLSECCIEANLNIAPRGIENLGLSAKKVTRNDGTTDTLPKKHMLLVLEKLTTVD